VPGGRQDDLPAAVAGVQGSHPDDSTTPALVRIPKWTIQWKQQMMMTTTLSLQLETSGRKTLNFVHCVHFCCNCFRSTSLCLAVANVREEGSNAAQLMCTHQLRLRAESCRIHFLHQIHPIFGTLKTFLPKCGLLRQKVDYWFI
jgi:hypothetical protein